MRVGEEWRGEKKEKGRGEKRGMERRRGGEKEERRGEERQNYGYLIRTLPAPSGVTTVAGANIYAAKLAPSPAPTMVHTEGKTDQ